MNNKVDQINNSIEQLGDIYTAEVKYNDENFYPLLQAMKIEYSSLDANRKKKYMDLLTEWYMREKDILRNKNI